MAKITVNETEITIIEIDEKDYISLTDMVKIFYHIGTNLSTMY